MANFNTQCCDCVYFNSSDPAVKCPHQCKRMYFINALVCKERILDEISSDDGVYRPILAFRPEIAEAIKDNRENYSRRELAALTSVLSDMNKHPHRYPGGLLIDGSPAA